LKKFERSTSFTVADHWILYENRWAKIACVTGIERPPKKKKLQGHRGYEKGYHKPQYKKTDKNGIHRRFSMRAGSYIKSNDQYPSSQINNNNTQSFLTRNNEGVYGGSYPFELTSFFCARRYSKSVYPTIPDPQKTTVVARKISKLCMKKPSTLINWNPSRT
jgi:hypothetical protein